MNKQKVQTSHKGIIKYLETYPHERVYKFLEVGEFTLNTKLIERSGLEDIQKSWIKSSLMNNMSFQDMYHFLCYQTNNDNATIIINFLLDNGIAHE